MKTVGAVLAKLSPDTERVLINGKYFRSFPRSIKRLHVQWVWEDYYYYKDWDNEIKIVDIYTTKGR